MRGVRAAVLAGVLVAVLVALVGGVADYVDHAEGLAGARWIGVALTLAAAAWALAGGVLAWHRPRNPLGWLILLVGVATQLSLTEEALARVGAIGLADASSPWAGRGFGLALTVMVGIAVFVLLGVLPALYPSGSLPSRAWWVPVGLVLLGALLLEMQWLLDTLGAGWSWPFGEHPREPNVVLVWAPFTIYAVGVVVGWAWCLVRLARATYPERQQLAWLLFAVVSILALPALGDSLASQALQAVSLYLLPAAIAVGVLRYRLLNIEAVLRRGLVYAGLTAAVVAVHALVTYLGEIWLSGDRLPAVVAAAVVAVGLLPLRERVQGGVDRLIFGRRQEPLQAVSALGDRVSEALPSELLDAVLVEICAALRAGGGRIVGANGEPLASTGRDPDGSVGSLDVALVIGGEPLGQLSLAPRGHGEQYSSADQRLLRALAPQVALAVRLLELARRLEGQRDRVVSARLEERQRLRGDLHDGLGPSMTGIGLGLQALEDLLVAQDTGRALEVAEVLRQETAATVGEVRRIVDGLRPGPVEEVGMVAALRRALTVTGRRPRVELSLDDVPADGEIQDAVYRVALEAMNNAVRHARADTVRVALGRQGGSLHLEVRDDGVGIEAGQPSGVGLASMRARAETAGGHLEVRSTDAGTLVRMVLPLSVRSSRAVAEELP